jgi:hypothetical protein
MVARWPSEMSRKAGVTAIACPDEKLRVKYSSLPRPELHVWDPENYSPLLSAAKGPCNL